MNNASSLFTRDYSIRFSETGVDGLLKPGAAFNYFQDTAGDHAARLGVSGKDLLKKNLAWVLHRYQCRIERYPLWDETIRVHTWRQTHRRLHELRQFTAEDNRGQVIMRAKSSWILIHRESRRPLRLDRHLPALEAGVNIDWTFSTPDSPTRVDREITFPVRRHDLDLNHHANNAVFIQWALDAVTPDRADAFSPRDIEALFLAEAREDDVLHSRVAAVVHTETPTFLHSVVNARTGTELSRMKSVWTPRQPGERAR